MRNRIIALFCVIASLFSVVGCGKPITTTVYRSKAESNALRAAQIIEDASKIYIDQELYNLSRDDEEWALMMYLLADTTDESDIFGTGTATVWDYTSFLAAVNRTLHVAKDDETKSKLSVLLRDLYKEMDWFKGTGSIPSYTGTNEWTVYGVRRAKFARNGAVITGDQAVYDDQQWIIREFMDMYFAAEGEEKAEYLAQAEYLTEYVLDGYDVSLDENGNEYGGIPWGHFYYGKHTCSNGPFITPLAQLAEVYKDSDATTTYKYIERVDGVDVIKSKSMTKYEYYKMYAIKVYDYCRNSLMDTDGVFLDRRGYKGTTTDGLKVSTEEESLGGAKLTYNSGSVISGAASLYELTGDEIYLNEGRQMAAAAFDFFGEKVTAGKGENAKEITRFPSISITTWFNYVLFLGWKDLYEAGDDSCAIYLDAVQGAADYAYDNYYKQGLFPRDWAYGWAKGYIKDKERRVNDIAAAAETFALLSQFHTLKDEKA